ncbi:MAG: GIY-YIG nuclease family protein [Promethearchaeota archaeon]
MKQSTNNKQRKKRETLKDEFLGEVNFSPWSTIMEPSPHWIVQLGSLLEKSCASPESNKWIHRAPGHRGKRRNNLKATKIPETPGVYELRIDFPFYNIQEVVYVGHSNRSLFNRINQYCKNGSHKAKWINRLLAAGFSISVRYRVVHSHDVNDDSISVTYSEDGNFRTAQELEKIYLNRYDYALNVSDNKRSRMENHKLTLKRFMNGYPTKSKYTLNSIEGRMFRWNVAWPTAPILIVCLFLNPPLFLFLFLFALSLCCIILNFIFV